MVAKTQFAITGEDTRYFLNGAKFVLKPDSLTLVATDGHRLALVEVKHKVGVTEETGVILPKKTLLELGKLLMEGDGDVQFESGENHLFFDVGGRMLISRMIDGQFPAYERVIPKGNDKYDRVRARSADQRGEARGAAVERTVPRREARDQQRQGRSDVEQLGVRRSARGAAGGLQRRPAHDLVQRAVRARFPQRRRNRLVVLSLKDEVSQAVMKPVGAQGYDYTYVIMPMRI